ncbi:MAG: aldose 1-epimerase family protein [Actinomycetota bacterium]
MGVPRSGQQISIGAHGYEASVASIGASLRELRLNGRDLIVPFAADEVRPGYRGVTLAPWPNRVVDGRYRFAGVDRQLALTEPERGHALHGLLAWHDFAVCEQQADHVVLTATIVPQVGYPFRVRVDVEYRIDAAGLVQTVTATNLGADAAPWGTGPHPYLVAGPGRVDDWVLSLPAAEVLTVTDDRLIPIAVESVDAHPEFDFRAARPIGDTFIDHAFTTFDRGDGMARVEVTAADGTGVLMTWDQTCPWVQVHTADTPDPATHRIGLAVEPMTCPPNAFASAVDLIVLEPGSSHSAGWTISAI